jgi:type IV secretory pathway VirB2 component (pilin)
MAFESRCGARLASSEGNSPAMKKACRKKSVSDLASAAFAQVSGQSPWENAVSVLQQAFTSTIARGLSLVAIVVAGLTFAFGEGGSKRVLAGVLQGEAYGGHHESTECTVIITDDPRTRARALLLRHVPWRATKNGHRFLTDTQAPAKVRFSTTDSPVPAKPRRRSLPAPSKGRREDRGAGRQKSPRRSRLSGEAPLP